MRIRFAAFFLVICLLLFGCNGASQAAPGTGNNMQATAEADSAVLDYPSSIGTSEEKLLIPLLSDDVFGSTAKENGLEGTLYKIYGTVEKLTADSEGNIITIHFDTHKGTIVIGNPAPAMGSDSSFNELGTIDQNLLSDYFPMPHEGEFCRIFAEYQGMSETHNCPFFVYGGEDYLTTALLCSLVISSDYESETTIPSETETTAPPPEKGSKENPYSSGMYKVGTDLPAGEYLFFSNGSQRAYVCASSDSNQDDILENNNFSNSFFMTVADGQYLEASRCYFINASDYTVPINEDGSFDEGMYRVGIDIPAGEYKLTAEEDRAYWCLYNDSVVPFDIEDNDLFEGSTYVTVREGQYLIIERCTAKPV